MKAQRRITTVGVVTLIAGLTSALSATAGQAGTARTAAGPVSCQLSWTMATGNSAYPDTSATYWSVK
jgi:hypothetical protein